MSKRQGLGQVRHYFNQFNLEEAGLPSNVKAILERKNNAVVNSITIGRNPVQSAIQGILKTVSTVPYDNLFHLFLVFNTNKGQVLMEKNARINMSTCIPKMYESISHFSYKCTSLHDQRLRCQNKGLYGRSIYSLPS